MLSLCRMSLRYLIYPPILFIAMLLRPYADGVRAQAIFCPPNLNFEQGNLSNWSFYTGTCCPIVANTLSGPVSNRHVLTSGTNLDPYGAFPIVAPGGGSYSLKLGNNSTGRQAERARYYIRVPSAAGTYIFIYRYAVVFQDPGHAVSDQPRFEVKAYDSLTQDTISCNQFTYVASSNLPGFTKSPSSGNVYYKPWTTATIDLTGYNGRTVAIDFASGDCDLGAHFGYGYVDMQCDIFQVNGVYCREDSVTILTGPPGFQYYKWMDTTFTHLVDTGQVIRVSRANALKKYAIIVTPYSGFGCSDTFYTNRVEDTSLLNVDLLPDTTVCIGTQLRLAPVATGTNLPFKYQWSPGSGLSCVSCLQPFTTPPDTAVYTIVVSDSKGCKDTAAITINVVPYPVADAGPDTIGCISDSVVLNGTGTGEGYLWYPVIDMSGANTLSPKIRITGSRDYYLVMSNAQICNDTDDVHISAYPQPVATAGNDTSVCKGIQFQLSGGSGGIPVSVYAWSPASHVFSPNQQNPTVIADTERIYKLVVTTDKGCSDSAEVKVGAYPIPVANAGPDTIACRGTQVKLQGSGGSSYVWYPVSMVSPQNHAITWATATQPRKFYLEVTSMYNCKDTDDVYVDLYPDPVADAGPDTVVCQMEEYELKGSGGASYLWSPSSGLSNPYVANPRTIVTAPNTYILTITSLHGCIDDDTVNVNINALPVANAGNDTAICKGSPSYLHGSGGVTYEWQPAGAVQNPFSPSTLIKADSNTLFVLAVTDSNGCKDTDDVFVIINPLPLADAGPDTGACIGDEVQLHATGGGTYEWSPASSLDNGTSATPKLVVSTTTSYLLKITNSYGCDGYDTVLVIAHPHPEADAGNDTAVCPGAEIKLYGNGGVSYEWSPSHGLSNISASAPIAIVTGNVSYQLKVTNEFGCQDSAVIEIDTIPVLFDVEPPVAICKGEETRLRASGADLYEWQPADLLDDHTKADPIATPLITTEFKLVMTELTCNRVDSFYVTAVVHSLPGLTAVAADKDCGMEYGMLTAKGAVAYRWTPEEGLEDPYAAVTKANPAATTLYTLTGTDEKGCTDTASVELKVFEGDGRLFIPDAFTPNRDGINDCYRVFVPGDVTEFQFSVYNRFGERVFHATDRNHCWDGTYKGIPAELSTYFYYYEAVSSVCGRVFRKGDMHLLR